MNRKNFIVPHDFTPVADIALEHAIATAKPLNAQVFVLHVVSKEKNIKEAEEKLNKEKIILITSNTHYYRAQKCFEKQGIKTFILNEKRTK